MAKDGKDPHNTKRTAQPRPVDFTPPQKKQAKPPSKERKPLPQVKTITPQVPQKPYDRGRPAYTPHRAPTSNGQRPRPAAPPTAHKPPPRTRRGVDPGVKRGLNLGITVLIIGAFVIMIGLRFFGNNALAVFLDEVQIGYMPMNRETTSESFHNEVVANLIDHHQTEVVTSQHVTVAPARWVARRNIDERGTIISRAGIRMAYQISVRAIYINNQREALVRSDHCIAEIERRIMSEWENENTVDSHFATDWSIRTVVVDHNYEGILSPMEAIRVLDRMETVRYPYEIQDGDTLGSIATTFGTTATEIANTNGITLATRIYPGNILYIYTRRPILSVITVDEVPTYFDIDMPVEETENPDMEESITNIIQEGSLGRGRTVQRITRLNGVTTRTEQLASEVITEPVPHIVEVGTRPAALERR
jgi:hypothetical protein